MPNTLKEITLQIKGRMKVVYGGLNQLSKQYDTIQSRIRNAIKEGDEDKVIQLVEKYL